jgi:hypothetical protein
MQFSRQHYRALVKLLLPVAMQTTQGIVLTQAAVDELRRRHVLLPPVLALEKLCATVATPAQGEMHRRLTATIEKRRSGVAIGLTFPGFFPCDQNLAWGGAQAKCESSPEGYFLIRCDCRVREEGVVSRFGNLRTLWIRRPDRAQRPKTSLRNTFICVPDIVARQINVLPAQRGYMR